MFRPLLASCIVAAAAHASVAAAQPEPVFIRDAKGCSLFDPVPKDGESVIWAGACRDGFAEGAGTLQWVEAGVPGTTYIGRMSRGIATGHGTETFANGSRFDGEFANGHRNGHGVMTWKTGARFEGEYVDGHRTGHGALDLGDGTRYEGNFEGDEVMGQGAITFQGARLEGTFTRGQLSGPGVLIQLVSAGVHRLPVDVGPATSTAPEATPSSAPGSPHIVDFRTCRPIYPTSSARSHATGTSSFALLVDADGQVQRARITQPNGDDLVHQLLDMSALVALSNCQIVAGTLDGRPAARWFNLRFEWRLE